MKLEIIKYKVTGLTPLQMANPASMLNPDPVNAKKLKKQDFVGQAAAAAYKTEDGLFYLPTLAFRKALLSGTKQRKCGKVSAMGIAMASVFTANKQTIIIHPKTGKAITDYKVETCRGVNPSNGAGIVISRPQFDEWGAIVEFKVDTELIADLEILDDWFNRGGAIAGVGAFRIENRGECGRFEAQRI